MVRVSGFEPEVSSPPDLRDTKLHHTLLNWSGWWDSNPQGHYGRLVPSEGGYQLPPYTLKVPNSQCCHMMQLRSQV